MASVPTWSPDDRCPDCSGRVQTKDGESFCPECGLVVSDSPAKPSKAAQFGTDDPERDGQRYGPKEKSTFHDFGRGSQVSVEDTDAYGTDLSNRQRAHTATLEKTQRFEETHRDRRLRKGLTEVRRLVEALALPKPVHRDAANCYRQAFEEEFLIGRSIEEVAGACVYIAAQRAESPVPYESLEEPSRVELARIKRAVLKIHSDLDIEIAPQKPQQYVNRIVSDIDAPPIVATRANQILDQLPGKMLHSGVSPTNWAATAVHVAGQSVETSIRQKDIAESAGVTTRAIQRLLNELENKKPISENYISPSKTEK